jgi:hypothetical protein
MATFPDLVVGLFRVLLSTFSSVLTTLLTEAAFAASDFRMGSPRVEVFAGCRQFDVSLLAGIEVSCRCWAEFHSV